MTTTRRDEGTGAAQRPVFLDESGHRRRLVNRFGACLAVASVTYAVIVCGEMAQTGVGPLAYVPEAGNGLIAGFPADTAIPGLLAAGAPSIGRVAARTLHPVADGQSARIQPVRTHEQATASRTTRTASAPITTPATSARTHKKLT